MINATAVTLAKSDVDGYEALKAANRDEAWGPFDRRNALIQGQTIDDLGPDPLWHQLGSYGATTARALDERSTLRQEVLMIPTMTHAQQDAAIQTDLAILRTKVIQAMHGRSDASVFTLDLVELALEMCEALMRNEITATVPLLMEQLGELLGTALGPDEDEPPQRVSAA